MCLQRPIEPDHLGSPRKVLEPSRGTALWDWPILGNVFGTMAANEDADGDGIATPLNLRFPGQQYDPATGLHYNYFRDYDPATGRYVESDPIGLKGGMSTFGYVSGAPLSRTDTKGLVEWFGQGSSTSAIVGGGGFFDTYLLKTKCVNGKKGFAQVFASGTAVGFGIEISGGGGPITFEDGLSDVDPKVFEGQYKKVSYGAAFGAGWGGTWVTAGDATSITPWGRAYGFDYSIWATVGHSWLGNHRVVNCNDSEGVRIFV